MSVFWIILTTAAICSACSPSSAPAATTAPVASTVPPIHAAPTTGFMPTARIPNGMTTIITTVKISDMPTASASSSFLARAAAAAAMAADTPHTDVAARNHHDEGRALDLEPPGAKSIHENNDDRCDHPGDEEPRETKAQDIAKENLRTEEHQTCLDIQLTPEGWLDPPGCADRIGNHESDRKCPEGVPQPGRPNTRLLGAGVRHDRERKDAKEADCVTPGDATHDLNRDRGEQGQDKPERDEAAARGRRQTHRAGTRSSVRPPAPRRPTGQPQARASGRPAR